MLRVDIIIEPHGYGDPSVIEQLFIARGCASGENPCDYNVWRGDPRVLLEKHPKPDAVVRGHIYQDGAAALVARAIAALRAGMRTGP